jgi:hypothetical protein
MNLLTGQLLINGSVTPGDTDVNVTDAVYVLQAVVNVAPGNAAITNLACP